MDSRSYGGNDLERFFPGNSEMVGRMSALDSSLTDFASPENWPENLDAARRSKPDLVIADIMMPRLDGIGLLSALRSDPNLFDIPVILLSARADEEARIEALRIGVDDYLVKPFFSRELVARIRSSLAPASAPGERANNHVQIV